MFFERSNVIEAGCKSQLKYLGQSADQDLKPEKNVRRTESYSVLF